MNKKFINLLFIFLVSLFLISTAYASDDSQIDDSVNSEYEVTSNLSNENIQTMFDNAKDGDTFKFTSNEYNNISLVVDKQLNIISKNSVVNDYDKVTDKA